MHTQRTIMMIIGGIAAALSALVIATIALFGLTVGSVLTIVVAGVVVALYRSVFEPWQRRWGATDEEVTGAMPGDELMPGRDVGQTTRAVTILASSVEVWPWLVQLGFGRAGWYSYDWIDNDGRPSAVTIRADLQRLDVGDTIAMTPAMGFTVRSIDPGRSIVSESPDDTTWALRLTEDGDHGCRLVSRFRIRPPTALAARCWMLLADPGAFVMERRMLDGIRRRAQGPTLADA